MPHFVYLPVDVVVLVDGLDGEHGLADVEPGLVLGERVLPHEQRHHVAPGEVLHDEVEELAVLEGAVERDDAVVVHLGQEVPLGPDVLHLPPPEHLRLLELLHGVHVPRGLLPAHPDLAEGPFADHGEQVEVLHAQLVPLQPHVLRLLLLELLQDVVLLLLRYVRVCQLPLEAVPSVRFTDISSRPIFFREISPDQIILLLIS